MQGFRQKLLVWVDRLICACATHIVTEGLGVKKDQERLALLVLGQRGKLEKIPLTPAGDPVWRLVFCLRLAALLHRSRDEQLLPVFFVKQSSVGFQLELPADWLVANPLSAAALADEALVWQRFGLSLRIKRRTLSAVPD